MNRITDKTANPNRWKISASELPTNTVFPMLDVLKFLFAYFVVVIHINTLMPVDNQYHFFVDDLLAQGLARIAVPFYFTAAGFLLYRKVDLNAYSPDRSIKYIKALMCRYGLWMIPLYYFYTVQFWFLIALAFAIILIDMMLHFRFSYKAILIISSFLFVLGLLGNTYRPLIASLEKVPIISLYYNRFQTTRNGLFFAPLFLTIGVGFAKKRIVMKKGIAILGFVVSVCCLLLESILVDKNLVTEDHDIYLMLPLVIFFLMYLALHVQIKEKPIYPRLRYIGEYIFFLHLAIVDIILAIFPTISPIFCYLLVFVIATALAVCFTLLSEKGKWKYLRLLVS